MNRPLPPAIQDRLRLWFVERGHDPARVAALPLQDDEELVEAILTLAQARGTEDLCVLSARGVER